MAKIYYKRIVAGLMTIENVPVFWKKAVEDILESNQ